jgi:hypothetical protein
MFRFTSIIKLSKNRNFKTVHKFDKLNVNFWKGNIRKLEEVNGKWNKPTRRLGVLHEIYWTNRTKLRNQIYEYI